MAAVIRQVAPSVLRFDTWTSRPGATNCEFWQKMHSASTSSLKVVVDYCKSLKCNSSKMSVGLTCHFRLWASRVEGPNGSTLVIWSSGECSALGRGRAEQSCPMRKSGIMFPALSGASTIVTVLSLGSALQEKDFPFLPHYTVHCGCPAGTFSVLYGVVLSAAFTSQ